MYGSYTKIIPSFFQELLQQIIKINIFSLDESIHPSKFIHYQPYPTGINIYLSEVIKLSHELSHIVETRDNNKLLQFDYGIRKYFPTTHKGQLQSLAKEARVRGIQTRMVEIAYGNSQLLYQRHPYVIIKPAGNGIGKFTTDNDVMKWCANLTQSAYNDWSKDRIVDAWKQKSEFINHWLETSVLSKSDHTKHLLNYKRNEEWFVSK